MLVGRDLGLPKVVVLVVVVVVLAIGFVIRSKWRQAAARREEIKRLLIFASEEAATAEIEAAQGYLYTTSKSPPPTASFKPPYNCAVCFSPTTTRCAKCKAARYCSGRCQIIHWRQGHKDECRPYVAVKDVCLKQEDGKDSYATSADGNRPEIGSSSSEEYSTFSTSSRSSVEVSSISSEDSDVTSEKIDQNKSNHSDEDSQPRLSTSSSHGSIGSSEPTTTSYKNTTILDNSVTKGPSRVVDGSNGLSSSESSTGFWGGTLHSKKSTIDELDSSNKNKTILDPNGSGSNKSNDAISLSKEIKSTKPPKYNSEILKHKDAVGDSDVFKETKVSSKAFDEKSTHVVNTKSVALNSSSRLASQSTKPVTVVEEKIKVSISSSKHSGSGRNERTLKVVGQPKTSKLPRHYSQKAESDTAAHKYSCKGLFSYEMFVKLYNWKQIELRPFGLINCGNSCYANAVLQCLTHTPPLNAYFLQGLHSKACDKREWCFTCEFEGLVLKAKNGSSSLSPVGILSQIETIGSSLNQGRQEDAHEFLRYAIDTLQSVCLKEAGTNTTNSLEEETTLIGLTFGGYLRSKIKCMKCGGKSERNDRMMDLTVEIQGNIATLEEALDKFTCTEILDGENKYKCSRCKSYEKAKKTLTLLEAPNVLTIALKRFQSGKYGKLNKSIRFPEILDMAPYVCGTSDKSPVYRLYGVVVHVDIMNAAFSGHYVCYVKNVENRWFKIDDNRVKEVDVESVLTKGAYMLLYARCSPRAPRLIRSLLARHHHDPKKHRVSTSFGYSTQSWDVNRDHLVVRHRSLEEESSSSSDGSAILSESCSCSTERDSSSIDDHISWDWEHENNSISSSPLWRNLHSNSSDSDTSSSSSSSFPSPLYSRHHPTLYHNADERRKVSGSDSFSVDRLGGRSLETSKPALRRSTIRVRYE